MQSEPSVTAEPSTPRRAMCYGRRPRRGVRAPHRPWHRVVGAPEPYIVAGNELPLAEGMAFSVEPGISFSRASGSAASRTSSSSRPTGRNR